MKQNIAQINNTESWFFENMNKIDKPLAIFSHQEKKGEESNQ